MYQKCTTLFYLVMLIGTCTFGQDMADADVSYAKALRFAYAGKPKQAQDIALHMLQASSKNEEARAMVARTYSWSGDYAAARKELNILTSTNRTARRFWILAIKNELYANNNATAFGLANKALVYIKKDPELRRLQKMAQTNIENHEYPSTSWIDQKSQLPVHRKTAVKKPRKNTTSEKPSSQKVATKEKKETAPKTEAVTKEALTNRVAIRNAFTVFDSRYEPVVFSTLEYKKQTRFGSILPRINYSNRNGEHGVQYDLDLYPKFSKRFYAYLNYGYSEASIYPNHKFGGDLYVNLPGAMEFSAGGRYISLATRNVTMITNSIGHYRGNYYFSLRSNLVPKSDNLVQFSGNLLIRKYLKDADNFFSFNVGMGYSPELRQLISGEELLAETLLYIESQRMSLQYQFTGKQSPNLYSASLGVSRRELSFESGSFIWAVSAGLAYQVKF